MTNGGSVVKFGLSPVLMTLVLAAAASLMAACVASPAEAPTPEPRSETTEVPATPAPSTEDSGPRGSCGAGKGESQVGRRTQTSRLRATHSLDRASATARTATGAEPYR